MALPAELEASFWQEVQQYQQEKQMQYITCIKRIGIQKGSEGLRLLPEISKIEDVDVLRAIKEGFNRMRLTQYSAKYCTNPSCELTALYKRKSAVMKVDWVSVASAK